ncbi:hypothetical protein JKP88DRAFT_157118 [Tribonema minus]|uniref:Bro-N domain-containing protein n=1 Tax=Tribonema minus TaxID=303371 RepID=A0A835ZCA0_9STRA|nr:hypothetical protein JKP88DRAFT_157118 [Tribonema minus]
MDIIKTFVINNTNYDINIVYHNGFPLFRASEIGAVLGMSNVRQTTRDYDEDEKVVIQSDTPGGLQNVSMLTELGLYRLLMRSDKAIARPFQKWVCQVLASIRETGKYEMEQQFNEQLEQKEIEIEKAVYDKVLKDAELQKHLDILDVYDKKPVVYFAKFGSIGDQQIIKIGQTTDIKSRTRKHWIDFSECILIKVFPCSEPQKLEHFLHMHAEIKSFKYNEPINGQVSNEAFLFDGEALKRTLNIAVRNISKFKAVETSMAKMEGDVRSINQMLEKLQNQVQMCLQQKAPESGEANEEEATPKSRRGICTVNGYKIQRYSADGLTLLETYNQMIVMERDENLLNLAMRFGTHLNRNTVTNASKKGFTYLGFRWAMLDRSLPDDTIQTIGVTTLGPNVRSGPITELNDDMTSIAKVFQSSNDVIVSINARLLDVGLQGIDSISGLCKAIKRGKSYYGRFYMAWADCPWAMQDFYMAAGNEAPIPCIAGHCRPVNKIDPITHNVLETYYSTADVNKRCKVGKQTLQNAINGQYKLNGFIWAYKE